MSPRQYRAGQRQVAAEQTRTRILEAACELLTGEKGPASFSMDAVAKTAGVARMTVYYQFDSKTGLLEALFDDLAQRGGMARMPAAFMAPSGREALTALLDVLNGFYASGRVALRRLRGLGILDPELDTALQSRSERRRGGLLVVLNRLLADRGAEVDEAGLDELVEMLFMLTSFETFDLLAGPGGESDPVARRVEELILAVLDRRLAAA
ncbi:helix-turn-helix domain-containing protein [Kitasatospora purpeofusca]|uniref:TetR/AcrR family transcriptional regulator n=1 Tax=Kitasatospora purpeofusca TaxID=67352 RepID=UPI0022504DB0|nr:TetR/AcrR family transcriptional regulator [Kitasatospora purpeofusca]MCX4757674.1 TetR/AcrR family transcriptional regulator [Kitasatospora purpeofusca]WSR34616.1 TetR/AcrR family transcriptional regulator [Kitasatospora purpeofusca]WSR42825.1 TetR/AcrR family transcriptional regulator [Kitasatospora purpeofusca]